MTSIADHVRYGTMIVRYGTVLRRHGEWFVVDTDHGEMRVKGHSDVRKGDQVEVHFAHDPTAGGWRVSRVMLQQC